VGVTIAQPRLDELWDFDDPAGSERRLRDAAAAAPDDERGELMTQVARALCLQERHDEAEAVLDGIHSDAAAVRARVALERGRLSNAAGRADAATPLFREAAETAASPDLLFVRIDALHMLALADAEHAERWTDDALSALHHVTDARTLRWRVALHNNIGWTHFDHGRFDDALVAFERARHAAVHWGTLTQVQMADEAIVETRATIDPYGR
jgi:tetratricopeptide (TPR) repeat protein